MKLYLSSYKIGDQGKVLSEMLDKPKKIAVISNALDCYSDQPRRKAQEEQEMKLLDSLGLKPCMLDLRDYFGNKDSLLKKIQEINGLWVCGGNVFVLRVAMKKSGLDEIIKNKYLSENFVYAGYSAGPCVLSPTLKGFSIVDNTDGVDKAYPGEKIIWEGLNLLNFVFVPHYKSNHPESEDIEKEVEFLKKHEIKYKAFRDGDVFCL